jgi:hypothetical protein
MIGMPTPTVSPGSGAMAARPNVRSAGRVRKRPMATVSGPPEPFAVAVIVYSAPGLSVQSARQVVRAASSVPRTGVSAV